MTTARLTYVTFLPQRILTFGVALCALASPATVGRSVGAPQSPPQKIAVVDTGRLITDSAAGKAATAHMRTFQKKHVAEGQRLIDDVTKLDTNLKTNRATMNEADIAKAQEQIAAKRAALEKYAADSETVIGDARDAELRALNLKIRPAISFLAKKAGYTAVFNKYESGLLYSTAAIDITSAVIARMNATPAKK